MRHPAVPDDGSEVVLVGRPSRGATALVGVLATVLVAVTAVAGVPAAGIVTAAALGASLLLRTRVTLASSGVEARLSPFFHRLVPAEQISGLRLDRVSPLRDFGGWGLRKGRRSTALLLGADVLEIDLVGGERLVVSVDVDAARRALVTFPEDGDT